MNKLFYVLAVIGVGIVLTIAYITFSPSIQRVMASNQRVPLKPALIQREDAEILAKTKCFSMSYSETTKDLGNAVDTGGMKDEALYYFTVGKVWGKHVVDCTMEESYQVLVGMGIPEYGDSWQNFVYGWNS